MIPISHSDLLIGHGSFVGKSRKYSANKYAVGVFRDEEGEIVTLGVMAQGMGKNDKGRIAAELATQVITDSIAQTSGQDYRVVLEQAFSQASRAIADHVQSHPHYERVIAICAASLVVGRRLYTAYVGYCDQYLLHSHALHKTNVAHTLATQFHARGEAIPDEIKSSTPTVLGTYRYLGGDFETTRPNWSYRYLGDDSEPAQPDFGLRLFQHETPEQAERNQGLLLEPEDTVLVCAPGIDFLEEEGILDAVIGREPQAIVDELIQRVRKDVGDYDAECDLAVIVMQVPPSA